MIKVGVLFHNPKFQFIPREEKQLDVSVDALIQKVTDLKNAIASFIFKLETEFATLTWPTVLDNFALLSGQLSSLNRQMKNEKCPIFKNYMLLPLTLSPDRDADLEKLSEGRVMAFNHEVVPDYLRTKPAPEVEELSSAMVTKVAQTSVDNINKQLALLNKITHNQIESITSQREDWDADMNQKYQAPVNNMQAETHSLVSAVAFGKGLKPSRPQEITPRSMPSQDARSHHGQPGYGQQHYAYHGQNPNVHINKAPSNIKTNIRAAGHPYGR